ncbi:PadR family transcriptional regulator [Thermosipho sp. (in: thermotogales)]|jgi:poly-beta-hydroxybutyrate-responsive repressor|nr:PadR family transcriptional regulator [Thermosipho sp. (in: thermotogales)]MBZ4650273.1 transcriptional regulator, PadR family [Thermosipho sp. (in: thermotogales)]MDK2838885.1 PadR family transcriptional regulator, regulatory protein PadR [Thermosipho sp. (in: thermotogales)]MDK2900943.1 PadR family transcriptional regulator, regulatory protein PadR [Thermosipho sp. (in: thermotogales)]
MNGGDKINGMRRRGMGRFRKTFIEPFVLLIIAQSPLHGYEIANKLLEFGIELTGLGQMGNLYRILSKLEEEGLLRFEWDNTNQGPSKKVYYITPKGLEYLAKSVEELEKINNTISRFIIEAKKLIDM